MRDRRGRPDEGAGGDSDLLRKVFIVARGRADVYASLNRALVGEPDVLVIYDRRTPQERTRERRGWRGGWAAPAMSFTRGDRRMRTDVDDDIRVRGFGVVHLDGAAAVPVRDDVEDDTEDDVVYDAEDYDVDDDR